ncbi:MAG: hypothetical protein MJ188_05895 [Treponema sp.]|nr:hypothetical protein [Treponema sp.]
MNASKKIFLTSILGFGILCSQSIFAQNANIKSLVPASLYDELVSKGQIVSIRDNGVNSLELMPDSMYKEQLKSNLIKKEPKNYPFTYESIYLKSKDELLKLSKSTASTITIDDVARVCRSVSKMQGMTYFSSTKNKVQTLYDRAYMIEGPNSKNAIPDKNTGNADGQVSYCLQNDASFGECRYKLNYNQSENEMLAVFSNLDTLGLGPFKAVYPEKMTINILVIDCGKDLLVYLYTDLDSVKFPGIKGQITDSMTARMDAVYDWFVKQF